MGNRSINELACIICTIGNKKLQWKSNTCLEVLDSELDSLTCTAKVNKFTCLHIRTKGQFCKFTTKCEPADYTVLNPCVSLVDVNKGEFCESPTDVPCKFDAVNRKCVEASASISSCIRGINQSSCLTKATDSGQPCLF